MRPRKILDGSILRANVRAYAALGAPVAAVLKNNAYGWGVARMTREIDDVVESYVVSDEAEFWMLRACTSRPIRLLSSVAPERIAAICAYGGIPTVAGRDEVAAAAAAATCEKPITIRVGIIDASGWSGITAADAPAFAAVCATHGLRTELWTHVTSSARATAWLRTFDACVRTFHAAGARVAGIDIASTAWASPQLAGDRLRIGAGLFGARLGGNVAVTCAIRVDAPTVRWHAPRSVDWAGYGDVRVPSNRGVLVLRCGYGDGFPKKLAGDDDILSVGMQFTSRLADEPARESALIDHDSDLDRLAERLGIGPHELIIGLSQQT